MKPKPVPPGGPPSIAPSGAAAVDLLAFADWVSAGQKGREVVEAAEERTYVAFLLDREEFGLPVESVREVLRVGEVTRVPQAPPHIRGVTNVRGPIWTRAACALLPKISMGWRPSTAFARSAPSAGRGPPEEKTARSGAFHRRPSGSRLRCAGRFLKTLRRSLKRCAFARFAAA